ncbi:MAG: DEAD/DEAH box helicase [Planctomycetaceae bacterium]
MTIEITISPAGHLVAQPLAPATGDKKDSSPQLFASGTDELCTAFVESTAAGLTFLATNPVHDELSPGLIYWRGFALRFFQTLCGLNEESLKELTAAESTATMPTPDEGEWQSLVETAPPMRGLEYLSPALLNQLWNELKAHVLSLAKHHDEGPIGYLRSVNPNWNLLGKVTFHLAENKQNPSRPFAFLATFAHRLSAQAKLQHLPLAEALRQYAGEKNQPRLAALLEPVRRAAGVSSLVRELLDSRALFQPQAWSIRQAHQFLVDVPLLESCGLSVRVPDWWNRRRPARPEVQVRIGQTSHVDMGALLDFSMTLALDGEPLTDEERRMIESATDGLALLRGRWVEVDQDKLRQTLEHWKKVEAAHAEGVDFIEGMRMIAGFRVSEEAGDNEEQEWFRITPGESLNRTLMQLRDPAGVVGCKPGRDLQATLRPYQRDGVRWLWFVTRLGCGACLADDMGLGKTIQVIDLLLILKREAEERAAANGGSRSRRPSLLIVPASLIGNWKSEFARFAPTLNVFYAHSSEYPADELKQILGDPQAALDEYDAVITTYGLVRKSDWFGKREWNLTILDEAQAIKNAGSAQSKAVRRLKSSGRIVLSGTPVENHLGELWSLFDFCSPGLLGNASRFKKYMKQMQQQQDAQSYGGLRRLIRPYILRRLKTDPHVVPDLPDKTEMRVECGLTRKQVVLYEKTLADLEHRLKTAEGIDRRGLVLATLMKLKQICNHAAQFLNQRDYPPEDSGKFRRMELICEPIVERQERMLVFTQFQTLTEPLAEFLATVFGREGLILHGGVPVKKRQELVRAFQSDDGPPFFVISLKAGGTGLNLTAASHVVHFDRWWNPAVENQATDRAFRIGQKRNVLVHKFVCRGTVEERIDEMIRNKQELADEILNHGAEKVLTEMSDRELMDFVAIDLSRVAADD